MTIEEAIKYAERAYKESHNGLQYALKRGETKFAERCKKDVEKYGQLAAYLRELQERRKADSCEGCVFEEGSFLRCMKCKRYKKYYDRYEAGVGTDET